MVDAQTWLKTEYVDNNKRDTTKEINSKKEKLEGKIMIENFPELEIINLWKGEGITEVTIFNCPKVRHVDVSSNKIEEIEGISGLTELERLNVSQNEIKKDLDISKNKKLEVIICFNNPFPAKSVDVNNGIRFFNGSSLSNPVSISTKGGDYKEKLLEIAKNLGIKEDDLKDKTVPEIEALVKDKIKEKVDMFKELEKAGIANMDELQKALKKLEVAEKVLGKDYVAQIEVPTSE